VTRAVVVGSGSAGRRHALELRAQLPDEEIVVVRRPGSTSPGEWLAEPGFHVVDTVDAAAATQPEVAVVASPAPLHRTGAEPLFAAGAHVLVEKPLAATVADAAAIVAAARRAGRSLAVGYHLRCSDIATALVGLVAEGAVGTPRSFRFEVGQHLAQWRAGIEPDRSVTARRELGGGVLLELSHELDAVAWCFGTVAEVDAELGFGGAPTDGLVETFADVTLRVQNGTYGAVHLDMVSETPFRRWTVEGTAGTLIADLLAGRISRTGAGSSDERTVLQVEPGERERAEAQLIMNLLEVATGRAVPRCTGADGLAAVAVVDAIRASAARRGPVAVPATGAGAPAR
jgi:predicted dehydrogenase